MSRLLAAALGALLATRPPPVTAYRYHPETGEDAADIPTGGLTDAQKAALASIVRAGARFYWLRLGGEWRRVERANYEFVARATGERVEWVECKAEGVA